MTAGDTWTVAGAKARLSEVLQRAQKAPQVVTRNGTPMAVVVSSDEWARKSDRRGSLSEFFANSPLRDSDIDLERLRDAPRDPAL